MEPSTFFNLNGTYGFSAYGKTDFKTPQELLSYMDEMGVARCAVRCVSARDTGNVYGNKMLLDDLRASGEMGRRLIPVFVTSPTMMYDHSEVANLAQTMERENARILSLYPSYCRFGGFYLWEIEPVLQALSHLSPVVCLPVNEVAAGGGFQALIQLAYKFPNIQFVLTSVAWGKMLSSYDVMRRCSNVYLDSAWLHTRSAVELTVRHFGADRIVFGLGPRSNAGSSIAALMYADISPEECEMIAHGNLERMLDLQPICYKRKIAQKKPLWEAFRTGKKIKDVDIVDAHAHLGPMGFAYIMPEYSTSAQSSDMARVERDQMGVNLLIVSFMEALFGDPVSGNRAYKNIAPELRGTLIKGYYSFNPHHWERLAADLETAFNDPFFVGFKILPDYWETPGDDPRYRPVWEYANKHRLPVLIHTWEGKYDQPVIFEDIIREFPDVQFLLGHSGGGDEGRQQAEDLCERYSNVYLEFCGSFTSSVLWEDTIALLGNDRIVYGSDTYGHDSAWEMGRLLSISVPDEQLIPILGANMRRVLAMRR